ncbi:MAG: c-type cytochrome [Bacteroidetes bacterium]|nr:c-type cytochrome [Bacteroidota bacterium]
MKNLIIIATIATSAVLFSCGGGEKKSTDTQATTAQDQTATTTPDPNEYDPKRGEGKYTAESLALTDKLDATMATAGETASGVKCASCHKYTDEKLVGPGWKDVTKRRAPEWIMNFITNPDPMLDKDPEAQAMLELCLVRMPNQNLTDEESRQILEFMRKNDGVK